MSRSFRSDKTSDTANQRLHVNETTIRHCCERWIDAVLGDREPADAEAVLRSESAFGGTAPNTTTSWAVVHNHHFGLFHVKIPTCDSAPIVTMEIGHRILDDSPKAESLRQEALLAIHHGQPPVRQAALDASLSKLKTLVRSFPETRWPLLGFEETVFKLVVVSRRPPEGVSDELTAWIRPRSFKILSSQKRPR